MCSDRKSPLRLRGLFAANTFMRYALLIAWREFAENAKTKGFWLGLLLFPGIILLSIQVPVLLASHGTCLLYTSPSPRD